MNNIKYWTNATTLRTSLGLGCQCGFNTDLPIGPPLSLKFNEFKQGSKNEKEREEI